MAVYPHLGLVERGYLLEEVAYVTPGPVLARGREPTPNVQALGDRRRGYVAGISQFLDSRCQLTDPRLRTLFRIWCSCLPAFRIRCDDQQVLPA